MENVINMTREEMPDKMLRAKDLQEIFINTSQATFDNWVRLGLIDRYKIGGGVYYKLKDVKKMIENCLCLKEVG
jgi:hypothetical protein